MIAFVAPLLVRIGIPERLHRALAYVVLAVAAVLLVWWAVRTYDARVIERYDDKREAAASGAREKSAEERAADAMTGLIVSQERETAIAKAEASEAAKPPEARATVAPQNRALNCARLKQAGMTESAAYREVCQ
ncbi:MULTISPECIES: hypothetical protein [unclassified Novosphingobium]|uniref:hypothetical protein n=1 Tax=unclassified Novosphingobium TaxID=2644732 RepID=UPI00135CA3AA|nr:MULTISPECIES: hypothetical protein [unclassified Novosphingobium]